MTILADDLALALGLGDQFDDDRLAVYTDFAWDWLMRTIGRDFSVGDRTDELYRGTGKPFLVLKHYPISAIKALTIDGQAVDVTSADPDVAIANENSGTIERLDGGVFPEGPGRLVKITYTGGPGDAPPVINAAALEGAAYLYQTFGGRSSVSDGGTSASFETLTRYSDETLRNLPLVHAACQEWGDVLKRR
jgi:hypothetical protein